EQLLADLICLLIEDDDIDGHVVLQQELADRIHGNSQRLVFRIAVDTGRYERKSNRLTFLVLSQRERSAIAGNELVTLSTLAAEPARTHGMKNKLARQFSCASDLCAAVFAA